MPNPEPDSFPLPLAEGVAEIEGVALIEAEEEADVLPLALSFGESVAEVVTVPMGERDPLAL